MVGLALSALMVAGTQSARSVEHLRTKSFAIWVASNRLAELELAGGELESRESRGEAQMAGRVWHWRQQVRGTDIAGLKRVDVDVFEASTRGPVATREILSDTAPIISLSSLVRVNVANASAGE